MLLIYFTYTMKSNCSIRLQASTHPRRKQSNTTTLASSSSGRNMRANSFQDEPFPKDPKRRLLEHKLKPSDYSDDDDEEGGMVVEEEESEGFEQKRTIPHFIVMSDHGEFAERSRTKSAVERGSFENRCRSMQLLRLPQVNEEKREEDEQHIARFKLPQVKDRNQFGQRKSVEVNPLIDLESMESHFTSFPELIMEAETEEYSRWHPKYDRTALSSGLEKLKVDEIDQQKFNREGQAEFQEIIEQERLEEETESVKKLSLSLQRLGHEAEYLNKFKSEELRVSINEEEEQDEDLSPKLKEATTFNTDHESQENNQ